MEKSISKVATLAMDMFYQSYRPADAFLQKKHFALLVVAADAKLKVDEYKEQQLLLLRKRAFQAVVSLSENNYITREDIEVKKVGDKAFADLPFEIMSFPDVGYSLSIASVIPESNCQSLIPATEAERWQLCNIKDAVFYIPKKDKIEFINHGLCGFKKISLSYIAQMDENGVVNVAREMQILNMINVYVKSAKEGVLIDMTNDGNPNTSPLTEVNSYLLNSGRK